MAFKTKNGTWRVHARHQGQRISKTFRTKILAEKFEAQLRLSADLTPLDPKPKVESSLTFGEFADRWLHHHSEVEKAESSQREDRSMVKVYLKPLLGERPVVSLTRGDYLAVKAALKAHMTGERKMRPKTANNVLNCLKTMVRTAVRWGLLEKYPWDELNAFPVTEQPFDYWTTDEMRRFFEGARFKSLELADLALFAFHTGLRLGEITGLRWSSVDLAAKRISVSETYNAALRKQLQRTKNGTVGSMPLNDTALAVLGRRKAKAAPGGMVFSLRGGDVTRTFQRLAKRLGVRPIRFHDLRHSFASNLVMSGVDIYTVQRLMRHKSLSQTQRYAHLAPAHLADAIAKISGTDLAPC